MYAGARRGRAQVDGRWAAAYDSPSTISRLRAPRGARGRARCESAFEELDSQDRYAILYRVHDAKRPTRQLAGIEVSSRC